MPIQDEYTRRRIVREYLAGIEENTVRLVCYMFTRGYPDWMVRRDLRLSRPRFREIRAQIAQGLLDAGIILREK